jgi:hypothetical protein
MSDKDKIESSLMATIQSEDVFNIAADAAELGIDAVLEDGILKDIPFVNTVVSVAKVGLTIRDSLLINKVFKFIRALREISKEEREKMIEKLEGDPEYGIKVGIHLMEILDKMGEHRKPEMLARVFAAYAKEQIDIKTLHRLNNAIENIPFYEIDSVRKIYESFKENGKSEASDSTYIALQSSGLIQAASGYASVVYQPNDLCGVFVDLELDKVGT